MTAGEDLESRLRAIENALASHPRLALRVLQPGAYLGQAATISVTVSGRDGKPLPGAAVTLVTAWGTLRGGDNLDEGGSITVQTGVDGQARVVLRPVVQVDSDDQQDALEALLEQMDPAAVRPSDAEGSLELLARQYRWEANESFRGAVDAYFREFGRKVLHDAAFRDYMLSWSLLPATVVAYVGSAGDGGAVTTVATLTVQFRNWLGPWFQVYEKLFESQSSLGADLQKLQGQAAGPEGLLAGVFNRTNILVDREFGEIGKRVAQHSAESAIGNFLEVGVKDLPPETRLAVGPALTVGSRALSKAGVGVVAAIGRTHVITTSAASSLAGKVNRADFDTALAGKANAADLQGVQVAVAGKADRAALESFQTDTTRTLAAKADAATFETFRKSVNETLATRVAKADFDAALAVKANSADLQGLQTVVAAKADRAAIDSLQAETTRALAAKADAATFETFRKSVNETLATRITKAELDALGANLQLAIASKADAGAFSAFQTSVNTALTAKLDSSRFEQFSGTVQGRLRNVEGRLPR